MENKHFRSCTTIVLIALIAAFCLSDSARAGAIVAWGYDGYGQVSNTPTGSGFIGIAAGNDHSIALTPEPTTLSLILLGGIALAKRQKQRIR
jgi:hypothetical protein